MLGFKHGVWHIKSGDAWKRQRKAEKAAVIKELRKDVDIMREIIEEYAGVAAGGMAAVLLMGLVFEFVLGGAGLHDLIFRFAQCIC